tara:strand:- start:24277 stop:24981 length:705 start_codon:yes stop_codon:yes gene_type:complete
LLLSQARPETTVVNPQLKVPSTHFNFRIGLGIPNGDFAADDDGIAKSGVMLEADLTKLLGNDFYLNFSIKRQSNDINRQIINDDFKTQFQQQGISGLTITTTSIPWRVTSFMMGFGTISSINGNDIVLMTRFSLGYADVNSPEIRTTIRDQFNNGDQIIFQNDNSGSFAFQLGLGLKINVSKETDILLSTDYFNTQAKFSNVGVLVNGTKVISQNFEQNISILAISLGIAFKLD